MNVLVIMHAPSEGPGTLGEYLVSVGATMKIARLYNGERLPRTPGEFDAVVSMGGPMNVYEEDRYPFLRDETELLREAVSEGVPTLGICLGAQMVAKARGAVVRQSPVKEIGWSTVSLTDAGMSDVLFQGLPPALPVFQWHEDMFELPDGAFLLATSEACPNQAFRCGSACGLQFHVEVTREMLARWFADSPQVSAILSDFDSREHDLLRHARAMYAGFLATVTQQRASAV